MNFGIFSFSWVPDVFCLCQSPHWIAGSYFSYSTYCNSRYIDQKKKAWLQYLHLVHFKNTKVSRRERNQFQANNDRTLNRYLSLSLLISLLFSKHFSSRDLFSLYACFLSDVLRGICSFIFRKLCVHMRVNKTKFGETVLWSINTWPTLYRKAKHTSLRGWLANQNHYGKLE